MRGGHAARGPEQQRRAVEIALLAPDVGAAPDEKDRSVDQKLLAAVYLGGVLRGDAQAERDFLIAELTHALGIGGRRRRMGDDVERARTAVTARIRDAIGRIDRASPAIGEHFRRSVRTGTYCSYDPPAKVDWRM